MSEKVSPISPDEVVEAKAKTIPSQVIEAFNYMIAKNWDGHSSTFKQEDVVNIVVNSMNFTSSENVKIYKTSLFRNHNLDVEDIYRALGWKVYYDKPAYNETYDATFEFKKS